MDPIIIIAVVAKIFRVMLRRSIIQSAAEQADKSHLAFTQASNAVRTTATQQPG